MQNNVQPIPSAQFAAGDECAHKGPQIGRVLSLSFKSLAQARFGHVSNDAAFISSKDVSFFLALYVSYVQSMA